MTKGVFVGLSTIDLVQTVDEFPLANKKAVARSQEILVGGPATNAAVTFNHLGGNALLVAAVGRNALCAMVKIDLQKYGVSLVELATLLPVSPLNPAAFTEHENGC